jgi:mono/diheme cytochrome c family protein
MKLLKSARLIGGISLATLFALTAVASSPVESGKAVFKNSCVYCHGEGGEGNPAADNFWKMKIPRLNTEYIRSKSDAELTNVILNGKRKMPPAMAGKPETQHRTKVKAEQVPDLIAYVRTLKR